MCAYLVGVGGVGDVIGADVPSEDRAEDLVGQVVALGGVSQQVSGDLCVCVCMCVYSCRNVLKLNWW